MIQIGDIVKFDYGIAYYGIVVECKAGMVCVEWFDDNDRTEKHFYPMYDVEKVSK
jgi:hypothetical protein